MSEIVLAVVLGLVEGLTEFIPVSSTGHLILVGDMLGFHGERAAAFDVFIQLGAILAVVFLYRSTFLGLFDVKAAADGDHFKGVRGLSRLAAASFPALVVGFFAHKYIKEHLFNSTTVAAALIVGAGLMIVAERLLKEPKIRRIEELSLMTCVGIGVFQCLSLWPGMSRSGSTIVGGMLFGLSRTVAAEFSFLVAVPVMVAATGYDLFKSLKFLDAADIPLFAVGFVVSFISAVLAIRFFLGLLRRVTLLPFAIYRVVLGLAVLALS